MVISMANLLYKIKLDDKDKKLLAKSLRKNKDFLSSVQMTKKEFGVDDITMIERAINTNSANIKLLCYSAKHLTTGGKPVVECPYIYGIMQSMRVQFALISIYCLTGVLFQNSPLKKSSENRNLFLIDIAYHEKD